MTGGIKCSIAIAASLGLLIGCGEGGDSSDYTGSCDLRKPLGMCSEYEGQTSTDAAKLKANCALIGEWSSGRCTREAVVGGCRKKHTESTGDLIAWYYPDSTYKTAEEVKSFCETKAGTFLPP